MNEQEFKPETGQTHWGVIIWVVVMMLLLFAWTKRDSIEKLFHRNTTQIQDITTGGVVGQRVYIPKEDIPCDFKITGCYKMLYSEDKGVYIIRKNEGYKQGFDLYSYMCTGRGTKDLFFWLPEDYPPNMYLDSCQAKNDLKRYLDAEYKKTHKNDYLKEFK
jgi:hypothetical protein